MQVAKHAHVTLHVAVPVVARVALLAPDVGRGILALVILALSLVDASALVRVGPQASLESLGRSLMMESFS